MLIKVLAISTTQVKKSGRPLTLQDGSVVELDTSIGDTYSKRACRVVSQSETITVDALNGVIDVATASRSELWDFAEQNGLELPPELKGGKASTEKVRAGVLALLQG